MKRLLTMMLILALCLPMIACSTENGGNNQPPEQEEPEVPEIQYTFAVETTSDKVSDDEGRLLASYSYETLRMEPAEGAEEQVVSMAKTFNQKQEELLETVVVNGEDLDEWAAFDEQVLAGETHYTDELTVRYEEKGSVISVCYEQYTYSGSAYPTVTSFSYTFDLERGDYINPIEIADDPDTFRATVTDLILDQIMGMGQEIHDSLFEGYEATVEGWNDYYVSFGDDICVIFSACSLGPHALGAMEFHIDYSEVNLGEGGEAKLGLG